MSPEAMEHRTDPGTVCDPDLRQQVLILYLARSGLDASVCAWSFYDGTGRHTPECGGEAHPPYATGIDALRDGWRLIQLPPLPLPRRDEDAYEIHYPIYEFVFERWERCDD